MHFEDDPSAAGVRDTHAAEHRAFLHAAGRRLLAAGDLMREGAEAPVGSLWLVWAPSELAARELLEADPYFRHGLRRVVRVWRWRHRAGAGAPPA